MVSDKVQTSLRVLDVLNVYQPRIQSNAMHGMLEAVTKESQFRELFSHDLQALELYYGFGRWYMMLAIHHWFDVLTTRQLIEMICWAHNAYGQYGMINSISHDMGTDKIIEHMRSVILDMRFASTERLLHEYSDASGVFTGEHVSHFNTLVSLLQQRENLMCVPALYMMLASAVTSATMIQHVKDGSPWFVKLPDMYPTWSGDKDDNERMASIILNETRHHKQ